MISEQNPYTYFPYIEGGSYLIPFTFNEDDDITVTLAETSNSYVLKKPAQYSIEYKFGRGYVTLIPGIPVHYFGGDPSIIISRSVRVRQSLNMSASVQAPREGLEAQLDRITMMIQDLSYANRNALRIKIGDPASNMIDNPEDRDGKVMAFDDTAEAEIIFLDPPDDAAPVSAFMQALLETETIDEYRSALAIWDISYKSIANLQRWLNEIPPMETLALFEPYLV